MNNKLDFVPPANKDDMTELFTKELSGERVSIFIDAANLYYAANTANLKINFVQMAKWFRSHCRLAGLNFYTAFDPEDPKQTDFIQELQAAGYRVISKPVKVFENAKKGNMDIELAVDAMMQRSQYSAFILFSGDGDFKYLLKALSAINKKTVVLGVGGFTSFDLHQEASNYFFINRIRSVWEVKKNSRTKTKAAVLLPAKSETTSNIDKNDNSVGAKTKTVFNIGEVSFGKNNNQEIKEENATSVKLAKPARAKIVSSKAKKPVEKPGLEKRVYHKSASRADANTETDKKILGVKPIQEVENAKKAKLKLPKKTSIPRSEGAQSPTIYF